MITVYSYANLYIMNLHILMCGKWMAREMAKGHELYSGYTLLQM